MGRDAAIALFLAQPWVRGDTFNSFTLYTSRYTGPHIQSGDKPGCGAIVWNEAKTAPVLKGSQSIRLALLVPKTPMPAGGYPLMVYLHGSGGDTVRPSIAAPWS